MVSFEPEQLTMQQYNRSVSGNCSRSMAYTLVEFKNIILTYYKVLALESMKFLEIHIFSYQFRIHFHTVFVVKHC